MSAHEICVNTQFKIIVKRPGAPIYVGWTMVFKLLVVNLDEFRHSHMPHPCPTELLTCI